MFPVTAVCLHSDSPSLGLLQGHAGEGEGKALRGLWFVPAWPPTACKRREEQAAGDDSQARIKMEYRIKKDFFFISE